MPVVWIPPPLRRLTNDQETVRVAGNSVKEVIDQLETQFPGMKERLCDGDALRPGLAVVIDTQVSRAGLSQQVDEASEVHFVPAIGGGSSAAGGPTRVDEAPAEPQPVRKPARQPRPPASRL